MITLALAMAIHTATPVLQNAPEAVASAQIQKSPTTVSNMLFNMKSDLHLSAYGTGMRHAMVRSNGGDISTVVVQRLDKEGWTTVARVGSNASSHRKYVAFLEPEAPKSAIGIRQKVGTSAKFRLYMPASQTHEASWSPTVQVHWDKPKQHSSSLPFGSKRVVTSASEHVLLGEVSLPQTGTKAVLEKKSGSRWVTALNLRSKQQGDRYIAKVRIPAPGYGSTTQYRVRILQQGAYAQYISPIQTVKRTKAKTKLSVQNTADGVALPSAIRGVINVSRAGGARPIKVQQLKGKKWTTVKTAKTDRAGNYTYRTAATSATTTRTYRMIVPATSTHLGFTSKAEKIRTENPRHYTGYRKSIYNHIKKWCPNVTIATAAPNRSYAGLANMATRKITLVTGMSGARLKHVAYHECAHILEHEAFVKAGKHQQMYTRLPQIYGGGWAKALEHGADCMARAMGSKGPFSYTNNCKGYRITAAKKMIAGKMP